MKQGRLWHCPISNAYFGNAVTPIAKLVHQHQVEVGLGSDLSGGFHQVF